MLILKLLVILLVLNQHLNHSLAADKKAASKANEQDKEGYTYIQRGVKVKPQDSQKPPEGPPKSKRAKSLEKRDSKGSISAQNLLPEKKFNYFALNMIWPVTICGRIRVGRMKNVETERWKKCRDKVFDFLHFKSYKFTIHGLWPCDEEMEAVGRGPVNCPLKVDNDISARVADLENITLYWPSFVHDSDSTFWNQQWHKHGRCASFNKFFRRQKRDNSQVHTSMFYFYQAVRLANDLDKFQKDLRKKYPIPDLIDRNDVGVEVVVKFQELLEFIENWNNREVVINYQKITNDKGEEVVWVEAVMFCYDLDFKKINCPTKHENTWKGYIVFPTISSLDYVQRTSNNLRSNA